MRKSGFVAGFVGFLAVFALVPSVALAEEGAPERLAVAPAVEEVVQPDQAVGEDPLCLKDKADPAVAGGKAGELEGAVFKLKRPDYACPVTCEPNACMWFCAGGVRGCVNGCCVCYL